MNDLLRSKLFWLVLGAAVLIGGAWFMSSPQSAAFLWRISDSGKWFLPVLAVAALADSMNPCAFSILVLTIAFLVSLGKFRSEILKIGGAYILGIFLVYIAIGLGILQALHLFNTPHFMAKVGASLLILWGALNVVNDLFPAFPVKLRIPHAAHRKMAEFINKGSLPAAFILGAFVGLCEFPCTGGPYLLVLGMLHDQQTFTPGLGYLLLYNVIFVLPLAAILLIASDKAFLGKVDAWKKANAGNMRLVSGAGMIILGFLIFLIA
ncbi:MAG: hypothetical protein A2681_02650 [Candidatus Liptonbacteria bacterium RIFCSPHIGHO2_01_FULL_56_18b]|nr:MAG: hypothetical protein UY96_C0011G0021 [Parcubacteria group bacterium GW2011_GWB1_56_8]OGY98105.1 MAG: hypothetical protein A2681_02650 [Candidatus Liptonbacteria bacterium RIFCSPHIGHO2_01_FULL_56_18b]